MNDYISREKYLQDVEHYKNQICYMSNVSMDDCIKICNEQRKADVRENIHGKWIDLPDDRVQCSECNIRYPRFHRANFCDNCGADMREFLKNEGHRYDILKGESWG